MKTLNNYFKYWGKASGEPGKMKYHLLAYHSLDVAVVDWT
jgi:hypothetical protein